jgi:uncharacterized protein
MPTPVETVSKLLANTLNREVVAELVKPDADYVSLCYSNDALKRIMPYAGVHDKEGPAAVSYTFETVARIWANEDFQIQSIFGSGEDVAVFGKFTYRSRTLGKAYTSPFCVWCKVDVEGDGRVKYMQFMEDTFGTGATFQTSGEKTYWVDNGTDDGKEFTIGI